VNPVISYSALSAWVFLCCLGPALADDPQPATSPPADATAPIRTATLQDANARSHVGDYGIANAIFEQYLKDHPQDPNGPLFYGLSLWMQGRGATDPAAARALFLRARAQLLAAQKLGCTDPLLDQGLAEISPDGIAKAPGPLSDDQAVAKLMADGEAAYAKADYATAARLHQQALGRDPKSYQAALLCGDAFFAMRNFTEACRWFAQAVAINPDIETAHRYWADALMNLGKPAEATSRYLEAIVADPYNRVAQERFRQFAKRQQPPLKARVPSLPRAGIEVQKGKIDLRVASHDDTFESLLSMAYGIVCAKARSDALGAQSKKGPAARRTLTEEVAGLRSMNEVAQAMLTHPDEKVVKAADVAKWRPALQALDALEQEGLLEPYAVLHRADQDLAQDYVAYRKEHRDVLIKYLRRYWCGLD
jgi:tetratricopeptide (TPR) repeat protein